MKGEGSRPCRTPSTRSGDTASIICEHRPQRIEGTESTETVQQPAETVGHRPRSKSLLWVGGHVTAATNRIGPGWQTSPDRDYTGSGGTSW